MYLLINPFRSFYPSELITFLSLKKAFLHSTSILYFQGFIGSTARAITRPRTLILYTRSVRPRKRKNNIATVRHGAMVGYIGVNQRGFIYLLFHPFRFGLTTQQQYGRETN